MKIKFPSTKNEPLNFFRWFFNVEIINNYFDWFFYDSKKVTANSEPRLNPSQKSNRNEGYIEYLCPNNNFELVKVSIEDSMNKFIKTQCSLTIELITNNVNEFIKESRDYKHQLEFYVNELNDLEFLQKELIDEYPFLLKPLIDIQNYINSRYLKKSSRLYIAVKDKNEKLIYDIFGYLEGFNESNNSILSSNDYTYLIESIKMFVKTAEVPIFNKKIPKLNGVCNLTLRRTFYTLWAKLADDKKFTRIKITKFLKQGFIQFEKTEEKTLYNNLTKKPYWKEFVPNIIKELS
jgi:hypothetical protein